MVPRPRPIHHSIFTTGVERRAIERFKDPGSELKMIARTNRRADGKEYGLVVDGWGGVSSSRRRARLPRGGRAGGHDGGTIPP
ncbi:MAG TPA: hypothetical protein PKW35_01530 [Nannocystaceae bacterium]|nr:hypothetical protein [Nannocystaceae bacterium]